MRIQNKCSKKTTFMCHSGYFVRLKKLDKTEKYVASQKIRGLARARARSAPADEPVRRNRDLVRAGSKWDEPAF